MSTLLIGVLLCVCFDVAAGNPEMGAIQRLEKMIYDLQENSRVQEQKISAIIIENGKLSKRMSEMSAENSQMKQDISDLQSKNKRQVQTNQELTLKIVELNRNIRILFHNNEKWKGKDKTIQLHTLQKTEGNFSDDLQTTNSTTSTKQQPKRKEQPGLRLRRILLPGSTSLYCGY
jgi:predicted RNase H-like nuclease (RuvC/YqgF family)